jgi:hypothetical protein
MRDSDGTAITVSVYADENDRVLELEFVKWGDGPIVKPDWATFRLKY